MPIARVLVLTVLGAFVVLVLAVAPSAAFDVPAILVALAAAARLLTIP